LKLKKLLAKSKVSGITAKWLKNFVMVSVIIVSVVSLVVGLLVRWYYYNSVSVSLESMDTNLVRNYFSSYLNTTDEQFRNGALKFIDEFSEKDKMEVWIINENGKPIASSSGFGISENPVMPDYAEIFSSNKDIGQWIGKNDYGEKVMALSVPLGTKVSGEYSSQAAVRYIVSLEAIESQLLVLYFYIFIAAVVIILLVFVSGMYFIRSIVVPMEELSKTVNKVASGDYTARVRYSEGNDEISSLCNNINSMLEEISGMDRMKNDFISTISHEIRTPLTAVKGWGETLLQIGEKDPVMLQKGLEVIISESARLSELVEELLDFSRMQNGALKMKKEKIDILAELDETVFVFRDRSVREGIDFVYTAPEEPAPMFGDPNRIKQVFTNILDNALKYTEQGGKVTVNAVIAPDGYLNIYFVDTGCGISPEDLPKVKEKFYKTSINYRGSGIGLAVADEIIKLHDGEIQITSTLGEGTNVRILLPLERVQTAMNLTEKE